MESGESSGGSCNSVVLKLIETDRSESENAECEEPGEERPNWRSVCTCAGDGLPYSVVTADAREDTPDGVDCPEKGDIIISRSSPLALEAEESCGGGAPGPPGLNAGAGTG